MTRDTTKEKHEIVLAKFHELLRSGVDYTTGYMYKEAGKHGFLSTRGAANMINDHYNGIITDEMVACVSESDGGTHPERIRAFKDKFGMCEREARLIIRYIRRRK